MKPVYRIAVMILAGSFGTIPLAASEITANGLFPGKAVLTIDGKQVFISLGQTKRGVTLLEADDEHAVIEVGGKKRTLQLDKSIAKEYSGPNLLKQLGHSKSHVIQAEIIHQTGNLATFEVEYYLAKNFAEHANLVAKTYARGKQTEYWAHTYTPLVEGRNTADITIAMNEKAPERYVSDQVVFEILWTKKNKSGTTGAYVMEFIKQWER